MILLRHFIKNVATQSTTARHTHTEKNKALPKKLTEQHAALQKNIVTEKSVATKIATESSAAKHHNHKDNHSETHKQGREEHTKAIATGKTTASDNATPKTSGARA